GARLPDGSAIAYLSADTRLFATAERQDAHSYGAPGRRFKYSPTHDDVACCCTPNAVRLLPQLVSRMWLRLPGEPGIAAVAYGPCELRTTVAGVPIRIVEETAYPFSDTVELILEPERPVELTLLLREPGWAGYMHVGVSGGEPVFQEGWCRIRRRWVAGDRVRIDFRPEVRAEPYANGEVAAMRGPLQFVLPLEHRLVSIRDYPLPGFHDYDVTPVDLAQGYRIPLLDAAAPELGLDFAGDAAAAGDRPWDASPLTLSGPGARLVPMGATILRRASFPIR
ncbi:MAG TPA: hypothetical protein VF832_02330, partial [Longimicrobiales bacterium]